MMYYNVVVGCSSSDVTSGALQAEGPASFKSSIFYRMKVVKSELSKYMTRK